MFRVYDVTVAFDDGTTKIVRVSAGTRASAGRRAIRQLRPSVRPKSRRSVKLVYPTHWIDAVYVPPEKR